MPQQVDDDSTLASWLGTLGAGLILPGGGFVYLGWSGVGVVVAVVTALAVRFSVGAALGVDVVGAFASAVFALRCQRRGEAARPMPSPATSGLLGIGLPIAITLIAGGGASLLLSGYGQLGNRLFLRSAAFYGLWVWGAVVSAPGLAFVVLLALSGSEALSLAWKEARYAT